LTCRPAHRLNDVIANWVASLEEFQPFKGITFFVRLDRTEASSYVSTPICFARLFFFFAKNANAAMRDSIVRSFSIVTYVEDTKVRIAFTDSGLGIPPEKLKRICADLRAGATEQKERGLGLLTAQLIVTGSVAKCLNR